MRYAFMLTLAVSTASFAEDPFSCVDRDVADAFLGNAYQESRAEYSTSVPDGFVSIDVPAGASLVGSQTQNSMATVVYKTSMSPDRALEAATSALAESGWDEQAEQHRGMSGGFQVNSQPVSTLLCHDEAPGVLSVMADDRAGKTFVSYTHHGRSPGCNDEDSPKGGLHHDLPQLMRLIPTLKLPEAAKASNIGAGGDNDTAASHVDVSGGFGRTDLQSFLESQIRNQDWEFQTGWSSHVSSGSVWTKKVPEYGTLIGSLHLFDSGAEPVRVRFSVSPADPSKGTDHGSWSLSSGGAR
jgi:hypothetical protein